MGGEEKTRKKIFWEVDTQRDFMLPGGKLYVPGAEKRIPNMKRLVDAARAGKVFLVSDACVHPPGDPEFQRFPPHCIVGTEGAEILPELTAAPIARVPSEADAKLPGDLHKYKQIVLEKHVLDVFETPRADELLSRIAPVDASGMNTETEFFVFGVVTEYCVRFAAKGLLERGRRVALVTDAIETLDPAAGKRTLDELAALGAQFVTTEEALRD